MFTSLLIALVASIGFANIVGMSSNPAFALVPPDPACTIEVLVCGDGPDKDRDGLSDSYETNISHTDPNYRDTDFDGPTDGKEWKRGQNPLVKDCDSDTAMCQIGDGPDTDRDFLSDSFEINVLGTNPSRPDTDSDGTPDGKEVSIGTDPRNPIKGAIIDPNPGNDFYMTSERGYYIASDDFPPPAVIHKYKIWLQTLNVSPDVHYIIKILIDPNGDIYYFDAPGLADGSTIINLPTSQGQWTARALFMSETPISRQDAFDLELDDPRIIVVRDIPFNYSRGIIPPTLTGTNGWDYISGTGLNDVIKGLAGPDNLFEREGNDRIEGGYGRDRLSGGYGNDVLIGGPGGDMLSGRQGADFFDCGPGIDYILDFNEAEGDTKLANCENIGSP